MIARGEAPAGDFEGDLEPPLIVSVRRVIGLTFVVAFVEVTTYIDVGGVYPGIMTGNTVQLGRAVALHHWPAVALVGSAIGLFFAGCICASLIKSRLRWRYWELLMMASILPVVCMVRLHPGLHRVVELPLVALALGIQGETIASFGGVSLQTIVVTNNMVKFSDAFAARYLINRLGRGWTPTRTPALKEVILPGSAWLCYAVSAMLGAWIGQVWRFSLLIPTLVLILVVFDLKTSRYDPR